MAKAKAERNGIEKLLEHYKGVFRTPENLNHYSPEDYKLAEKKFLKLCVLGHGLGSQKDVL